MSPFMPLPTAAVAEDILGEMRALVATMGRPGASGSAVLEVAGVFHSPPITNLTLWRAFRDGQLRELLVVHEWPLVMRAHALAMRSHARELIELDQTWGRTRAQSPKIQFLGEVSSRVGRRQLERLRPLRDQRLIQRYLAAIDANEAAGWHPLAYAIVLQVFALPLRQGLVHYGRQTAAGLLVATPFGASLSEVRQTELIDEVVLALQPALLEMLPATPLVSI